MNQLEFIPEFARLTPRQQKVLPDEEDAEITNPENHIKVLFSVPQSTEAHLNPIAPLHSALQKHSYQVFLADNTLRMTKDGLEQLYTQLNQCDYLLLVLSPHASLSEMVTEEVRVAKTLQDSRNSPKPAIITLSINCPFSLLNHDLRSYLQGTPWYEWQSPDDTQATIQTILELLSSTHAGTRVKSNPMGADDSHPSNSTIIVRAGLGKKLDTPPFNPQSKPAPNSELYNTKSSERVPNPHAAIPKYPPQPIAEPELPTGQVELASAFYIERPGIDDRCYEELFKPGALIRIKAPRQMGKTSLMARILHQASQQGYATVPLSLQLADTKVFADLDRFLRWFCANITLHLELPERLDDYWKGLFGSKVACKSYFERYLLENIPSPLVLGLDEVDVVFKYPEVAADFFGLLRACHEDSKNREIWKKLRLVLVHSTEVFVTMSINQSPFNVGLPMDLPEFQPNTVLQLAQRYGLTWGATEVEQLMGMVGGHPYLVRLALYHIARCEITLEQLLETAATDAGVYGDHLRRHLWILQQHPDLAAVVKKVVDASEPVRLDSVQGFKLHSMGLVNLQSDRVTPRCDLYRRYYQRSL